MELTIYTRGVVLSHTLLLHKGVEMLQIKDIAPTGVRLPPELKEILKLAAKHEGRSLNSELIKRLERSLKDDGLLQA